MERLSVKEWYTCKYHRNMLANLKTNPFGSRTLLLSAFYFIALLQNWSGNATVKAWYCPLLFIQSPELYTYLIWRYSLKCWPVCFTYKTPSLISPVPFKWGIAVFVWGFEHPQTHSWCPCYLQLLQESDGESWFGICALIRSFICCTVVGMVWVKFLAPFWISVG